MEIRSAGPGDVGTILALIAELAEYERAPERALGSEQLLHAALFGDDPAAEALIAERDGSPVGFALFYRTFSTWECRPGLWLEDLYVQPQHRRASTGGLLLARLAAIALERGYTRMEWAALEWNAPALTFYGKLGAELLHEWRMLRLDRAGIERVAGASAAGT